MNPVKNLYLHVPFCAGDCSYCSFYKEPYVNAPIAQWLQALQIEIEQATKLYPFSINTIYMGGGTPSLLEPNVFLQIHDMLAQAFTLQNGTEWTVEANPESVSPEKCDAWRKAGVTRVSVGVQSFHEPTMQRMKRKHTPHRVAMAIDQIKAFHHFDLGLDLIAGFPDVPTSQWQESLAAAVALEPDHISVYECTIHPDCHLYQDIAQNNTQEASPELRDKALMQTETALVCAGYDHYEVSNYCKPGKRCLHNLAVWKGEDYLGLGPGAASRIGTARWTNICDVARYIQSCNKQNVLRQIETLTPLQDAAERLMFAFRLNNPVQLTDYLPENADLANRLSREWNDALQIMANEQLVKETSAGWCTTPKGMQYTDLIAESLVIL